MHIKTLKIHHRKIGTGRQPVKSAPNHQGAFFAINQLEALAEKGNQGLAWSEEEDELLTPRFANGAKITQLAKLHSRTYGASKANQT